MSDITLARATGAVSENACNAIVLRDGDPMLAEAAGSTGWAGSMCATGSGGQAALNFAVRCVLLIAGVVCCVGSC